MGNINRLLGEDILEDKDLAVLKPYLYLRNNGKGLTGISDEDMLDNYFSVIQSTYNLCLDKVEENPKEFDLDALSDRTGLEIRKILVGFVVHKEGLLRETFEPNHLLQVLKKFFFAYRPKNVARKVEVHFHPQEDISLLAPAVADRISRAQEKLHKRLLTLYAMPVNDLFKIYLGLK